MRDVLLSKFGGLKRDELARERIGGVVVVLWFENRYVVLLKFCGVCFGSGSLS